ncbi:MAG: GIY-YIG nuclease family protein [Bacteroidetes bacterium]|nr:GIY-YIG nuclease family protein [Bacteroidota bacterium]
MAIYYVYVLKSLSFIKHYTGQTEDLERRLREHNEGSLGVYTKNKGPWELIYFEKFDTRTEAMKREKYLKTGIGRAFLKRNVEKY